MTSPLRPQHTTLMPGPEIAERAGRAQLIVISGEEAGLVYPLEGETLTLGRGSTAQLKIADENVSRLHARLTCHDHRWSVEDLGSRNGTFVNDRRVDRALLGFGDRLRLGSYAELLFTEDDGVRDELLLRQRFEAVGRLSLGIAHDFNNMLAAMSASLDYLSQTPIVKLDVTEYTSCLQDMQVAVERASLLAGRLLKSGRGSTGRPERVDLSSVVEEVVQLAKRSFPRSMTIATNVTQRIWVLGDPVGIHQVLMNLMVNARDAMPDGGEVSITLRREGSKAVLSVRDTGVGMSEQTRARIFEPFFTTKLDGRGFGLGLATVRALVERLGGSIEVESALGEGTCFRVALPEVSSRAQGRVRTGTAVSPVAPRGIEVLLADDEAVLRRALGRVLKAAGISVVEAVDGVEAVDRARSGDMDLVILDVDMPRRDGSEACRMIHRMRPDIPIIILTGHDEAALRVSLREAGATAVLSKPVAADHLMMAVNTALQLCARRADERDRGQTVA